MANIDAETSELYADLDVGNLCIFNAALLKSSIGRDLSEDTLKTIASLGAQQLINSLLQLPSEYQQHVPIAKLPEPTTILPREKPIPKPKAPTKWEKFAQEKGIGRTKKEKVVWDDQSKDWRPRYGYKSIKNKKDWLIEVPATGDPNADYFGKAKEAKKERIAKNEYQRLRNMAKAAKMKVTNLESVDMADKQQLTRSLSAAKTATASMGRFTEKLPKEKPQKINALKRKFEPNTPGNLKGEKEKNLRILGDLDKKKPKLDVAEAVQIHLNKPFKQSGTEDQRNNQEKRRKSNKNKFIKTLFRGGKKNKKVFKRP